MSAKKTNIKSFLDSLVDEDGIKTDVTVALSKDTLLHASFYAVGTVIVSTIAFYSIRAIVKSMESTSPVKA